VLWLLGQSVVLGEELPLRARLLLGHSSATHAVAFSPDSKTLASGGDSIQLWDIASGKRLTTLADTISADWLAFSKDGKTVISWAKYKATVDVWNVATRKHALLTTNHAHGISRLSASADGKYLATCGDRGDETVRLWEVATGKHLFTGRRGPGNEWKWPHSLAFGPDNSTLAAAFADGRIQLWEVPSGRLVRTIPPREWGVKCLAFSPDGRLLVSGYVLAKEGIRVWETATGKAVASVSIPPDSHEPDELAFSPDGKVLASIRGAGIELRDVTTWQQVAGFSSGSRTALYSLKFSPDGKWLAAATVRGAQLWDMKTGENRTFHRRPGDIYGAVYSPDGKVLASARGNAVELWDLARPENPTVLADRSGKLESIAFHPRATHLATGVADGGVRIWKLGTKGSTLLSGHTRAVAAVAFHPTGEVLASGSLDGTVRLWDLATGRSTAAFAAAGAVRSLAFSPDGASLAAANYEHTVEVWRVARGDKATVLKGHTGPVLTVAFSPKGDLIASGGTDKTTRLWSAASGACIRVLVHEHVVCGIAFLPDGRLATMDYYARVKLWSLDNADGKDADGKDADGKDADGKVDSTPESLARMRLPFPVLALSPEGTTLAKSRNREELGVYEVPHARPHKPAATQPPK
jgi:WD40 repeat protein